MRWIRASPASPSRRMAYGLMAIAPALMLMIMVGSFLIFFFLPRVSSRYLSAYTPTSDVSTGFTDRVQLGRIGQIQQSSAVVMHIEIQNDVQGAYDLKWRGIALSNFDGRIWSNSFEQTQLRPSGDGTYRLAPLADPSVAPPAGRSIHYRVLMEPLGTNVFFLADSPRSLTGNSRAMSMDGGGAVYDIDTEHPINRYEGDSQLAEPDLDDLRQASNLAPPFMDQLSGAPAARRPHPEIGGRYHRRPPATTKRPSRWSNISPLILDTRWSCPGSVPRDPLANFLFERKKRPLRIFRQFDGGHAALFAHPFANRHRISRRRIQ